MFRCIIYGERNLVLLCFLPGTNHSLLHSEFHPAALKFILVCEQDDKNFIDTMLFYEL